MNDFKRNCIQTIYPEFSAFFAALLWKIFFLLTQSFIFLGFEGSFKTDLSCAWLQRHHLPALLLAEYSSTLTLLSAPHSQWKFESKWCSSDTRSCGKCCFTDRSTDPKDGPHTWALSWLSANWFWMFLFFWRFTVSEQSYENRHVDRRIMLNKLKPRQELGKKSAHMESAWVRPGQKTSNFISTNCTRCNRSFTWSEKDFLMNKTLLARQNSTCPWFIYARYNFIFGGSVGFCCNLFILNH